MLPNFLVIGAPRAGTTSLHHYLGQHPDVFVSPRKEPNFFAFDPDEPLPGGPGGRWLEANTVRDRATYEALFAGVRGERAIGEVSPRYLREPSAPGRIHRLLPEARLIAVLRNPVDRAFASFVAHRRDGWEPESSFMAAVRDEPRRLEQRWAMGTLLTSSRYAEGLERFFERFGRERVQVHLFDDLVRDPQHVLEQICAFLGVDPTFRFDTELAHNPTVQPRNPLVRALWARSERVRFAVRAAIPEPLRDAAYSWVMRDGVRAKLDPEVRRALARELEPEVLRVQALTGRDLSAWLPED